MFSDDDDDAGEDEGHAQGDVPGEGFTQEEDAAQDADGRDDEDGRAGFGRFHVLQDVVPEKESGGTGQKYVIQECRYARHVPDDGGLTACSCPDGEDQAAQGHLPGRAGYHVTAAEFQLEDDARYGPAQGAGEDDDHGADVIVEMDIHEQAEPGHGQDDAKEFALCQAFSQKEMGQDRHKDRHGVIEYGHEPC